MGLDPPPEVICLLKGEGGPQGSHGPPFPLTKECKPSDELFGS